MSTPFKQPPRMRRWQGSLVVLALLVLALLLPVAPVRAHHSAAMFDDQQSVTLSGTVKQPALLDPTAGERQGGARRVERGDGFTVATLPWRLAPEHPAQWG